MNKLIKNKNDIIAWLKKYNVENYTLVEDVQYGFIVAVDGDVAISNRNLTHIPIKFGTVSGDFYCYNNQLTSLKGAPNTVGRFFSCQYNQLTSLEGSPTAVGGDFSCSANKLTSLEGAPNTVGGTFYCNGNAALGEYQKITDFKVIKEKDLSDKEKKLLSSSLDVRHLKDAVLKL